MRATFLTIFLSLLLITLLGCSVSAFTLTPELGQELAEKLAAVEANPDDPHAHFDLAITYAYTNNVEAGWEELKKTNELSSKEVFAPIVIDIYTDKVIADPSDWKARFRLAFAYYFGEHKELAIQQFEEIIAQEPGNVWPYGYIGTIYGEMNEVDKAIEHFRKAIDIDPNCAVMHFVLGQAYYRKDWGWQGFWETMEALRLRTLGY